MKRCVSLKCVAARDWLMAAGNTNLKMKPSKTDQSMSWTCSWDVHTVHHSRNSSRTNVHKTWQTIYHWKRLIKHINNINMIFPNSNHTAWIDQKKVGTSNFKSRFLHQYSTKFNSISCMILYDLRSTQAISQFGELESLRSNLLKMQLLDLVVSRFQLQKQMLNDA